MPGKVDEGKWKRAKQIVAHQKGGVKNKYALVNHIYQNMGGEFQHAKKTMSSILDDISKLQRKDLKRHMSISTVRGGTRTARALMHTLPAVAGASILGGYIGGRLHQRKKDRNRYGYEGMAGGGETVATVGEGVMGKNIGTYDKIMANHQLGHQDLVKSMLAEVTGSDETVQKSVTSKAINSAKKLGTKALKHMKTNKAKYIAGAAGVGGVVGLARTINNKQDKKKTKKSALSEANDISKGILGRGLMSVTRGVRRVGSGMENLAGRASAARTAATGVAKPKGFINRTTSAIGGALRRATPRQVAIGAGVGAVGAAGYMAHRRNQNKQQG